MGRCFLNKWPGLWKGSAVGQRVCIHPRVASVQAEQYTPPCSMGQSPPGLADQAHLQGCMDLPIPFLSQPHPFPNP